jgi:hypothetical protein
MQNNSSGRGRSMVTEGIFRNLPPEIDKNTVRAARPGKFWVGVEVEDAAGQTVRSSLSKVMVNASGSRLN